MADGDWTEKDRRVRPILATLKRELNLEIPNDFELGYYNQNDEASVILKMLFKLTVTHDPTLQTFFSAAKLLVQRGDLVADGVNRYLQNQIGKEGSGISFYKTFFEQVKELGRGSFGTVFLARHKLDKRFYAIKKIEFRCKKGEDYRNKKVFQEVHFLSDIDSPYVVRYHGVWVESKGMDESSIPSKGRDSFLSDDLPSCVDFDREYTPESSIMHPVYDSYPEFDISPMSGRRFSPDSTKEYLHFSENSSPMNSLIEYPMHSLVEVTPSPLMQASPYGSLRDLNTTELQTPDLTPMGSLMSLGHHQSEMLEVDFNYLKDSEAHVIAKVSSLPDFLNLQNIYVKIELFLQMEFAGLWSLKDFIRNENRVVRKSDIRMIVGQILKGLIVIHARGLIHRDLKPENVYIDSKSTSPNYSGTDESKEGSVREVGLYQSNNIDIPSLNVKEWQLKIGDFGISKRDLRDASNKTPCSADQSQDTYNYGLGTWPYAAPEQLGQADVEYGCTADIFSLGVIMFELMVPAYSTEMERAEVIEALRRGITPPTVLNEFPELSRLLISMLAGNPNDRPTAEEALRDIQEIENDAFKDLVNNHSKEWLAEEVLRLRSLIQNKEDHSGILSPKKKVKEQKVSPIKKREKSISTSSASAI